MSPLTPEEEAGYAAEVAQLQCMRPRLRLRRPASPASSVLVADPPWEFEDGLPGEGRGAEKHYTTLTLADLLRYPLPSLTTDALLFLWRVSSMQSEAIRLADAWGFEVKSEMVWVKLTKNRKRHFGMGRYVRNGHETCLIATRGRGLDLIRDHSVPSVFEAVMPTRGGTRALHSAKPDEFYSIVEKLARGPYVEMFARRVWPGWTQFGDELPNE